MSAHREPDKVADYAQNARMRGLRVIIAGAGMSAALPGAVAAHTELPVIGVPLSGRLTVAGGLDAILSIVQMPPGVPVACVGLDNARNAAILAAQILGIVIPRYTRPRARPRCGPTRRAWRPGGGSRWRPARSCRRCSGTDGPTPRRAARRSARRRFTVAGGRRARARHRSRRGRVRGRARRVGRRGRPLDPLRADLLATCSTPALALQLRAAGEVIVPGAHELVARARRARARARRARCASGARTASTPSRRRSASSSRASRSRRTATRERLERAFAQVGRRRDLGRGRDLRGDQPRVRGARARAAGPARARTSPRRWSRATATPSC